MNQLLLFLFHIDDEKCLDINRHNNLVLGGHNKKINFTCSRILADDVAIVVNVIDVADADARHSFKKDKTLPGWLDLLDISGQDRNL